ncbi:TadE/TadG family type IV pilus assembly protein [Yersinia pekkanenii]|uniref:Tight adherance operon protein n=1 Tax=Yersinia pekkanenii TaxID=1288385 RepID=A0A0T9P5P0_9GAMM|nr:TadE/TadG family type IV pilus assembly protein [Yersinia pekkanenii]CNH46316.1 putative tight adherance operon protein [Yersinia pekkanenii]CRY67617.1 putative tight adherance operon protein [Yersinia pekkanenii]
MNKIRKRFFHSNEGSIAVEFSIVIVLFIFTLLSCAEIARLLYISASLDLAVSETAKSTKNKEIDYNITYQETFHQKLMRQQGVLGSFITANNAIIVNVYFSNSISDMSNNLSSLTNNNRNERYRGEKLARYTVSYFYRPIFFPFPSSWTNILLKREVIFAQEN